ncbi:hypothetical protein ZIOFF_053901 [Zingiber officinale]|uniref:Uncharacterized protein n=2 Tax=Zingiber officinale TaxID=94328 RepID=A0A8J5FCY7_ZINOF|nr:hypothetical protein ZIOFF_053901 [Zingiber officinale]
MLMTGGVKVSSSPGREKLPPPIGLARLLYGKAIGSRSRGRSASAARSSPMFVSQSRSRGRSATAAVEVAAAAAEEGEPSSPKVTCIGQVRMRNKNRTPWGKHRKAPSAKKQRSHSCLVSCHCFHKAFLCVVFKTPPGGGGGRHRLWLWRRRWSCIQSGRSEEYKERKKLDPVKSPQLPEFITCATKEADKKYDDGEGGNGEAVVVREEPPVPLSSETTSSSPPKNALLLMRCRSAPHNRASSLATGRFALPPDEELVQQSAAGEETTQEAAAEAQAEEEHQVEDDEAKGSESQRLLVLPRSKSEPAWRAAAKLAVPEAASCFWPAQVNDNRLHYSSPTHVPSPPQ